MRGGEVSLIPHLRRSSHKERRKDGRRPSGQEGQGGRLKTALGRAFMGHLFYQARGRGGGFEWGHLSKGETVSRDRDLRERKPWVRRNVKALRHRHSAVPTRLSHTLTASPPNATAPAAATGRRSRTQRAPPRRDAPRAPPRHAHVTRRVRPPALPSFRCSPLGVALPRPSLLGKMAAPGCSAPGLWVRGSGQCLGSLFTLYSKPLCSAAAAAASRPLDAQRLAERLRAQKQQQKTKEPVSPERPQLPRGSALTGVREGSRRVL